MTISTLDGVIAGALPPRPIFKTLVSSLSGNMFSSWGLAGIPAAGTYSTSLAGAALSQTSAAVQGALPFTDPGAGEITGLARFVGDGGRPSGVLMLVDRLWHNGGFTITSTAAQTVNSVAFPARDMQGSTNGLGVCLGMEISAAVGAATPVITVSYTNSDGTSGQTATNTFDTQSSAIAGTFFPLSLAAGDFGVRSVQSVTLDASWVSGTMNLVAYRPITMVPVSTDNFSYSVDAVTSGFPRLFNGSCPHLMWCSNAGSNLLLSALVTLTQG